MRDSPLLGSWVRRFLMEHVVSERNLARNTQQSYRDTLQLLLPAIARRARKPIDRLEVTDASADCVRQFLGDLEEKRRCTISTRNQRLAAIQEDRGIAYKTLTKEQQGLLLTLIQEHANVQKPELAKGRLDALRKAGLDTIKFAWMGGLERGQGHYYRVQGKTFLIEFDNTQNNANHIHTVWRDFKGDFGHDFLAEHYKDFPHPHEH
jgi:hypothetical protein